MTFTEILISGLKHKVNSNITSLLVQEVMYRDLWAAQVSRLTLPLSAQQLSLNSWKEEISPDKIRLHLRTMYSYLNSMMTTSILNAALNIDSGISIQLIIMKDNDLTIKTPIELCQEIYKEKLIYAQKVILSDSNIKILCRFFDAKIDEDSIRPI